MGHLKKIIYTFLGFICINTGFTQSDSFYRNGRILTFLDEFDTPDFTLENWNPSPPWGPCLGGPTYFTQLDNYEFSDGILNLVSKKEDIVGECYGWDSAGNFQPFNEEFEFTSGMLWHPVGVVNGYFETRFKLDAAPGTNAAFWLYGEENSEIDVFEITGGEPDKAQMTLHWKDRDPITRSTQSATNLYRNSPDFSEAFHTMGVEWTQENVLWYYGDEPAGVNGFDDFIRRRHVPEVPMHVFFTQDVGTLGGTPDTLAYPASFSLDYAAFYQLERLVAPVIQSQSTLYYQSNTPFQIEMEAIEVWDSLGFYPKGHQLSYVEGENYTVVDNEIIPDSSFNGVLWVNLRVNNGIDTSAIFQAEVLHDQGSTIAGANENEVISVFPNPANSIVTIKGNVQTATLLSVGGKTLMTKEFFYSTKELDVTGLQNGLYLLYLKAKKGTKMVPLQINR